MRLDTYDVVIRLTERMLGTVPKDPDVYSRYIAAKAPSPDVGAEEMETVPGDVEKSGWTGFHEDGEGIFIYNYAVLGFLKEAGNTLKDQLGIKNLRSKIDQFVYIEPRRIYVGKEPAGALERPLRAMTMQGPRVTVVRSDYVEAGTEIAFQVRILRNREITADVVRELLEFGQLKGLGQFRNGSYGRFEVVSFEAVTEEQTA